MSQKKRIVLLGPIAPPQWGPAVKNRIMMETLIEFGIDIIPINTLDWKERPLSFVTKVIQQCLKNPRIFLAVSKKGRLILLPLLNILGLFRCLRIVFFPCGGLFANEIEAMSALIKKLYIACNRKCSLIIVEREGLASKLKTLGLKNVKILPNFKRNWHGKVSIRKHRHETRLVFISRVRPLKGIEVLFQALDILQSEGLQFTLDIYGILLFDYKEAFFKQLSSRKYAYYKGVLNYSQVASQIAKYDVMVFPTLCETEGFPGVLVDAAIAGLPVIATNVPCNVEIIKNGFNGLLVKPSNATDLSTKIAMLIQNHAMREKLGANNKKVSEQYTVDVVLGKLINELDNMGWWEN